MRWSVSVLLLLVQVSRVVSTGGEGFSTLLQSAGLDHKPTVVLTQDGQQLCARSQAILAAGSDINATWPVGSCATELRGWQLFLQKKQQRKQQLLPWLRGCHAGLAWATLRPEQPCHGCIVSACPEGESSKTLASSASPSQPSVPKQRSLLQDDTASSCPGASNLPGFQYALSIEGKGRFSTPVDKAILHWTADDTSAEGRGASFAVEVLPSLGHRARPQPVGWVALGWSNTQPPQMLDSHVVLAFIDEADRAEITVRSLKGKNVYHMPESLEAFVITNQSIEQTPDHHTILRFRREYDSFFAPHIEQSIVFAYSDTPNTEGIQRHTGRSALMVRFDDECTMRVVSTRLNQRLIEAHAWIMILVWAVLIPAAVLWARYNRDAYGRWYRVHLSMVGPAVTLLLIGFFIPLAANRPYPKGLHHYQLGIAVFIMAMLQPFSAIPRYMTHHGHVVRHEVWAYLHWTIGRAALVFGIVNLFLGIGRYRSLFTLGSWAEEALGCYLGAILILCWIFENRSWKDTDRELREYNDELVQRIARLEGMVPVTPMQDDHDMSLTLSQAKTPKGSLVSIPSSYASALETISEHTSQEGGSSAYTSSTLNSSTGREPLVARSSNLSQQDGQGTNSSSNSSGAASSSSGLSGGNRQTLRLQSSFPETPLTMDIMRQWLSERSSSF